MKITKLRHQLYIFQIVVSILFLLFLGTTYISYQKQYKKDIDTHIENEIDLYKKDILSSIDSATKKLKKQTTYFTSIHQEIADILKQNPNTDLKQLQHDIKAKYLPSYIDIELFLINRSYIIYKTTYPQDLGLDLTVMTEATKYLDATKKDGKVHVADFVSTDALNMQYKLYSYSKLNDTTYLELGFIDHTLNNTLESLIKENTERKTKVKLYSILKDEKHYYYYEIKKHEHIKSKDTYYKSAKTLPETIQLNREIHATKNGIHTVYLKVFDESMFSVFGFENMLIQLDIDVSDKLRFMEHNKQFFIVSLLVFSIFSIMLVMIVKNKFTTPIEKMLQTIHNSQKIEDKNILSMENEMTEISHNYNELYDKLNEEIERNKQLTLIDPLTEAFNRKAYDTDIKELLSLYSRYKTPFTLILLDIDNFKHINDTYGHLTGDNVLKELVQIVQSNTRATDTFYRIGGEEFIIACKNTMKIDAVNIAEKLKSSVKNSLKTDDTVITVSIGVAEVKTDDTTDSIYKRVDEHLYYSKNNGKNMVTSD